MSSVRTFIAELGVVALVALPSAAWGQVEPEPERSEPTPPVEAHAEDGAHEDHDEVTEVDGLVVQATRSRRRVGDEPIRVEVLGQEEIEEKLLMRPGNISMLLAETGGLRVQVTAPGSGASNIRVQGMRGRYTQLLADGLPLYGGQSSSLGLLQIPPSDLGQVEVIKGASSALYGPSALGGVINLVSRRPSDEVEGELLLNATTREGRDITAYGSAPLGGGWSGSVLAGFHDQAREDLDADGWVDMPGYDRWLVRPRLFWEGEDGSSAYLTLGGMKEERRGGTLPGRTAPDGSPFPLSQDTTRLDAGLIYRRPIGEELEASIRAAATSQDHRHRFGDVVENDRHRTLFAEISLMGGTDRTKWVVGAAVQDDEFRSDTFPQFDFGFTTPGVFGQVEQELSKDLTLAVSARWDDHSEYGSFVSPRVSVLWKPADWTFRGSWGGGFYAPTPFVEEIEAAGLSRLAPLMGLRAETAQTASLDAGWRGAGFEANLTLFASDIEDAVRLDVVQTAPTPMVRLVNVLGVTRTRGSEILLRYRWDDFTVTGSYVYVDATEPMPGGGRRMVPLTPRHSGGVVAMWERHGRGRLGVEAYYTGSQSLEDNPYRDRGSPYWEIGVLGEIQFGRVSLFLNLENILDVRQTRRDPLLLPARAPDGRWTVDAWAPNEGFVANAGIRIRFGGGR